LDAFFALWTAKQQSGAPDAKQAARIRGLADRRTPPAAQEEQLFQSSILTNVKLGNPLGFGVRSEV
jgi:hypothetical protein